MVVATALLGMVTMILTTLNERRREMAILRSVGAGPRTVLGLLLAESAALTAAGIVLGPCFIFGWGPLPEMGVAGAAVATNIGRGVGVLYQLWHFTGNRSRIRLRLEHLRPDFAQLHAILRTAQQRERESG